MALEISEHTAFLTLNEKIDELGDLLDAGPDENETDALFIASIKTKAEEIVTAAKAITEEDVEDEYQ